MRNQLSKHGSKRYVERFDIKNKQQQNDFRNALRKGIPPISLKDGELKQFLLKRQNNRVKVMYYKGRAYFYQKTNSRNILITVFDVSRFNEKSSERIC